MACAKFLQDVILLHIMCNSMDRYPHRLQVISAFQLSLLLVSMMKPFNYITLLLFRRNNTIWSTPYLSSLYQGHAVRTFTCSWRTSVKHINSVISGKPPYIEFWSVWILVSLQTTINGQSLVYNRNSCIILLDLFLIAEQLLS